MGCCDGRLTRGSHESVDDDDAIDEIDELDTLLADDDDAEEGKQ